MRPHSPEGIADSLQALVPVRTRPIVRHKLVLLDTFNGRIAAAGGRLTAHAGNGGSTVGVATAGPAGSAGSRP